MSFVSISAGDRVMSDVCVGVKSRSVFPDLMPFETKMLLPSQGRAKANLARFGASCKVYLASLPQFELCVFAVMLVLARS